jgi:CDP-2,3-bis-(O-geranylgeranyl)-sn-glycerol synthase
MEFLIQIIQIIWFFLPAGIANMAPVLFKKVKFLNVPLQARLFGKNKTYRGFFFGTILAILFIYVQQLLYPFTKQICLIDYTNINVFLVGFLLGFGALFGDLTESFFKRRQKIAPGKPWVPFDQIDYVAGALAFVNLYMSLTFHQNIMIFVLFGIFHPLINLIGYFLKIKKNKF